METFKPYMISESFFKPQFQVFQNNTWNTVGTCSNTPAAVRLMHENLRSKGYTNLYLKTSTRIPLQG